MVAFPFSPLYTAWPPAPSSASWRPPEDCVVTTLFLRLRTFRKVDSDGVTSPHFGVFELFGSFLSACVEHLTGLGMVSFFPKPILIAPLLSKVGETPQTLPFFPVSPFQLYRHDVSLTFLPRAWSSPLALFCLRDFRVFQRGIFPFSETFLERIPLFPQSPRPAGL